MAIDVEDGTGRATANSYVSDAEAVAYFDVDATAADFLALNQAAREEYLQWATRVLDAKTNWRGYKTFPLVQALRWPRSYVYDRDGNAVASNIVPREVKAATCELAKWLLTNDPSGPQDVENLRKIVVDVIEIEYQEGTGQPSYPGIINAILQGLGYVQTGVRGFGRIVKS